MANNIPLVLLPGLLCDDELWCNQLNSLKDIADCLVPDLTQLSSIECLAADVLRRSAPQFALAGLSMGGYVAMEIMRQAPQRVLKLCLIDTSSRADTAEQKQKRGLLLSMSKSGQFRGVTPRLLPLLIHQNRLEDAALTGLISRMAERVGRDAFQRQQMAILNRIDSRPFLKDYHCSVQVIGGQQDALTPPEIVREIAENIPFAKLDMIESCGHLSPLEKPERVTSLMRRWLT